MALSQCHTYAQPTKHFQHCTTTAHVIWIFLYTRRHQAQSKSEWENHNGISLSQENSEVVCGYVDDTLELFAWCRKWKHQNHSLTIWRATFYLFYIFYILFVAFSSMAKPNDNACRRPQQTRLFTMPLRLYHQPSYANTHSVRIANNIKDTRNINIELCVCVLRIYQSHAPSHFVHFGAQISHARNDSASRQLPRRNESPKILTHPNSRAKIHVLSNEIIHEINFIYRKQTHSIILHKLISILCSNVNEMATVNSCYACRTYHGGGWMKSTIVLLGRPYRNDNGLLCVAGRHTHHTNSMNNRSIDGFFLLSVRPQPIHHTHVFMVCVRRIQLWKTTRSSLCHK